jgi:hypothetical protein
VCPTFFFAWERVIVKLAWYKLKYCNIPISVSIIPSFVHLVELQREPVFSSIPCRWLWEFGPKQSQPTL